MVSGTEQSHQGGSGLPHTAGGGKPTPIPVGSTEEGHGLKPVDALKVGLIYHWRAQNNFQKALKHEILSDGTSIATLLYFAGKYCIGEPLTPEDLQSATKSGKSILAVSPIIATLGTKWYLARRDYKKLLHVFADYTKSGDANCLVSKLNTLGLQLESLPDDIRPESFNDTYYKSEARRLCTREDRLTAEKVLAAGKRLATMPVEELRGIGKNLRSGGGQIAHFIGTTAKEAGYYLTPKGFWKLTVDTASNLKNTALYLAHGWSNLKHSFYTGKHVARHAWNWMAPQRLQIDIPHPSSAYRIEVATGTAALSGVWTEAMAAGQVYFIVNEAEKGIETLRSVDNAGAESDYLGATFGAALGLLHLGSALLAIKPAHELAKDFSHSHGQATSLRAQRAALAIERQAHEERIREIREEEQALAPPPAHDDRTPPPPA